MLEDDRIPVEVDTAIDSLDAIRFVYRRDNFVSSKYVLEKLSNAEYVISWLKSIAEKGENNG